MYSAVKKIYKILDCKDYHTLVFPTGEKISFPKKKYAIPANTLDFLKKKKLLYKVQPGEGQDTFEGVRYAW